MRSTWRVTGSAVGLALAALQGAAHAQSVGQAQPYVFDPTPAVSSVTAVAANLAPGATVIEPLVVPASSVTSTVAAPVVSAASPIYDAASPVASSYYSTVTTTTAAPVSASAPVVAATPVAASAVAPLYTATPPVAISAPVVVAPVAPPVAPPLYSATPPAAAFPVASAPVLTPVAPSTVYLEPIDMIGYRETRPGVTEVSGEALEIAMGARVDEALREIPGVFTRINPQQPGVAMNIRGFEGSGRVNSMVDGVRQNFRFTGHEAQGFTYVDQNLLSSIDVARGAETGVGGGGLAGSVNFRTLGVSDIVAPGQNYGALARAGWGSNGAGFSGVVGGGLRYEGLGVAGAVSYRDSDDYKNGNGEKIAETGQELVSGLVKAEFDNGGDHRANLGGVFYDNEFAANSYYQTLTNRTLTAGYGYNPLGNDLVDFEANLRFSDIKTTYDRAISPPPPPRFAAAVGRVVRTQGIGGDLSNRSLLSFGEVDLVSTNGLEYFRDQLKGENGVNPLGLANGNVNPNDGRATDLALFSENELSYGMFDLTAGLRYDRYTVKGSGEYLSGLAPNVVRVPFDVDISEGKFNPSLTLSAEPVEGLRPFVKWSRSSRAPTLQETLLGGSHPGQTASSFRPNPNLKPERMETWEFGARFDRRDLLQQGDSVTARANYYRSNVNDYILSAFNPAAGGMSFINTPGESKVSGVELEAGYDAGPYFIRAAYAHADSKLPEQTAGLGAGQYLPDDTASITAGVRLLDRKLTLGAAYNYVSGGLEVVQPLTPNAPTLVEKKDSYGVVDLFADYQLTDNFRVGAKVTNVFDKAYRSWLTPAPFTATGQDTGAGRAFFITGEARF